MYQIVSMKEEYGAKAGLCGVIPLPSNLVWRSRAEPGMVRKLYVRLAPTAPVSTDPHNAELKVNEWKADTEAKLI